MSRRAKPCDTEERPPRPAQTVAPQSRQPPPSPERPRPRPSRPPRGRHSPRRRPAWPALPLAPFSFLRLSSSLLFPGRLFLLFHTRSRSSSSFRGVPGLEFRPAAPFHPWRAPLPFAWAPGAGVTHSRLPAARNPTGTEKERLNCSR
ncbi:uncharacterized protein LOC126954883 [Macaca thibetana thibetana]|uniref:uncharacterized protein LOC126954883 n=1 Tax=Macaca thibetana thibetana TaxID=257877 RepID=UPI0021BC99B4|nr:uncharacterized protein LOC126954883 [Macaca thibetana thibetana]